MLSPLQGVAPPVPCSPTTPRADSQPGRTRRPVRRVPPATSMTAMASEWPCRRPPPTLATSRRWRPPSVGPIPARKRPPTTTPGRSALPSEWMARQAARSPSSPKTCSNTDAVAIDASGLPVASCLYQPYSAVRYSQGTMPGSFGFTASVRIQRPTSITTLRATTIPRQTSLPAPTVSCPAMVTTR